MKNTVLMAAGLLCVSGLMSYATSPERGSALAGKTFASLEERIDFICAQMTVEELVEQINVNPVTGFQTNRFGPRSQLWNERFSIPPFRAVNGARGIRSTRGPEDPLSHTVCFPTTMAQAATWNPLLSYAFGQHLSEQLIRDQKNITFSPGLNFILDPRAGRNNEYYSEDPLLIGVMAASKVRGIESGGTIATPKHYLGNEFEIGRKVRNVVIPERLLHELFLPPFSWAFQMGGARFCMTCYNKVNGIYGSNNADLIKLARKEGFRGVFATDWGATFDGNPAATGLNAGMNLELPGNISYTLENVQKALADGSLTRGVLEERVKETLRIKLSAGFYNCDDTKPADHCEQQRETARRIGEEGVVLLKNAHSILPLNPNSKVALIGPFVQSEALYGMHGSSTIQPETLKTPITSFRKAGITCEGATNFAFLEYPGISYQSAMPCQAEYYNNRNLEGAPTLQRAEPSICHQGFYSRNPSSRHSEKSVRGVNGNAMVFASNRFEMIGVLPGSGNHFTLAFYFRLPDQFPDKAVALVAFKGEKATVEVRPAGLFIERNGVQKQLCEWDLPAESWNHLTILSSNKLIEVYLDGNRISRGISPIDLKGYQIFLGGNPTLRKLANVEVDGLYLLARAVKVTEIEKLKKPFAKLPGQILALDGDADFASMSDEGLEGIQDVKQMSARYIAAFTPRRDGKYLFEVESRGGVRLFADGICLFDQWDEAPGEGLTRRAWVNLKAGTLCKLRLEYAASQYKSFVTLRYAEPPQQDLFVQEREVAAKADVAIVMVGVPSQIVQGENNDLESFNLPGWQDELIQEVVRVNPRTVVVLFTAGGVDMGAWVDRVPAIMEAFAPGQEAGDILFNLLFGKVNPSGKLPVTYPLNGGQLPDSILFSNHPDKVTAYGYRRYDAEALPVRFPFGHGLSYTTFGYSDLKILFDGKKAFAEFAVQNTGAREGAEVAQVYVGEEKPMVGQPVRELAGFVKVSLRPGEKRVVRAYLDYSAFSFYSPADTKWLTPRGPFRVEAGSSSRDIRLKTSVLLPVGFVFETNVEGIKPGDFVSIP